MVCQFGAGKNEFVTGGERQVNDDGRPPVLYLGSTACRSVGLIDFGWDMLTARVGTLPVQSIKAATCSRCRLWADC